MPRVVVCRCPKPYTACLAGRQQVEGDGVLVDGDTYGLDKRLDFFARNPFGGQIDKHKVSVCTTRDDAVTVFH